jgi:DNA repair protein RAD50
LCTALVEIITERRAHRNFQLVIITHDEEFMAELARVDGGPDIYYRVSKDEQTLSSRIQEHPLNEVL